MNSATNSSIDSIFKQLNERADLLHQFVILYSDYITESNDYGTGDPINMAEVHMLTTIEENPGINVSDLAQLRHRTKGAISQTIKKLEAKGYIMRRKLENNAKTVPLFPTEKGVVLSQAHKRFDAVEVSKTLDELMRKGCTAEGIDMFFFVMSKYMELFL